MSASEFAETLEFMNELDAEYQGTPITKLAGPPTWKYLHTLGRLTPPNRKSQDAAFETLKTVIKTFPCKTCAEHGITYLDTHPFTGDLQQYVCDFHNTVNEHLGKPQHSCDIHLPLRQERPILEEEKKTRLREILSRGYGIKEDDVETLIEAVPYLGGDVGISFPLGPGVPSLNVGISNDFPYTIFPLPSPILNRLSDPWHFAPPTPREMFDEMRGKKEKK